MATQWTAGTVSGQVLTAATMNTIGAAWEAYTPTLTQGVGVAKTINYARYCQIQKTVFVQVRVTATGGGLGGTISLSLPTLLPSDQFRTMGVMWIYDASTGLFYQGVANPGSNVVVGYAQGSNNNMGANSPAITIAAGDQISFSVMYEIA